MDIVNIVFPEGNWWFYPISLIWFLAIAIFLLSFPAIITSTGYWYEHETGVTVDFHNDLIETAATLYDIAFELWRGFAGFLILSVFSDAYYKYKIKRREAGWL